MVERAFTRVAAIQRPQVITRLTHVAPARDGDSPARAEERSAFSGSQDLDPIARSIHHVRLFGHPGIGLSLRLSLCVSLVVHIRD